MSATTSTKATPVIVLDFHKDVLTIARTGHNAQNTMARKMADLLVSRYGKPTSTLEVDGFGKPGAVGGPSYESYRNDQAALKQLAADKGLADNQWVRKPYAAAVKALYGALPVALTAEAIQKRAQRDADNALKAANAQAAAQKAGAEKGETTDRQPSAQETIEQIVARIGVFECLDACVKILQSDKTTASSATHINAMLKAAKAATSQPAAKARKAA